MATVPPTPVPPPPTPADGFWRAPLVPAALAVTAGIVLDHHASPPLAVTLLLTGAGLLAWGMARLGRGAGLALVYLALAGVGAGAALHHARCAGVADDDLSRLAPPDPLPVQVRGVLDEEPHRTPPVADPLRSTGQPEHTTAVLQATHLRDRDEWRAVSGRVLLVATGRLPELHVGDEVEVTGRLGQIHGPANPGEFDVAALLRDQGVRCRLEARKTPDAVTRLRRGWTTSFGGWLAAARYRGQRELAAALPPQTSGLAQALLLGEGSPLTAADWMKYVRTGVIHVLAISGQHLVVLAFFLWWALRALGVRQRWGAGIVAGFLLGYALLTGGRPPALRSAVSGCAACAGLLLRRRTHAANLFALAWLTVAFLNPADVFGSGCLLSFLSVAVLHWGVGPLLRRPEPDPLQPLLDEQRPAWRRGLRRFGRYVAESYLVALAVWLAVTPLAASRYSLVSPAGLLLGPPLTLLTSVALLAGFLLLLLAALALPVLEPFAWVVHVNLAACEWLVDAADGSPWSFAYVGVIPDWWLWVTYGVFLVFLTQPILRAYWRRAAVAGLGWFGVGLLAAARLPGDELRVTFLAVGQGGCAVLETPDGRTLLYDAGAIAGPDVARRQIAPFLWQRGVRRIDEVFLSHADLDHFNGLAGLLERFPIGQVTCTPTFADKATPAVRHTLEVLRRGGVPVRVVKAGDRLTAGELELRVLHPPPQGPDGNENARSLVVELRHAGHVFLLTGDLEGPGLEMLVHQQPPRRVDVFQVPHHGSPRAGPAKLAEWARPRLAVSCQGAPLAVRTALPTYRQAGAEILPTWPHGAVTVRSRAGGLVVETFVTRQRLTLRTEQRAD